MRRPLLFVRYLPRIVWTVIAGRVPLVVATGQYASEMVEAVAQWRREQSPLSAVELAAAARRLRSEMEGFGLEQGRLSSGMLVRHGQELEPLWQTLAELDATATTFAGTPEEQRKAAALPVEAACLSYLSITTRLLDRWGDEPRR